MTERDRQVSVIEEIDTVGFNNIDLAMKIYMRLHNNKNARTTGNNEGIGLDFCEYIDKRNKTKWEVVTNLIRYYPTEALDYIFEE